MSSVNPDPQADAQALARVTASANRINDLAGQLVAALAGLPEPGPMVAIQELIRVELAELRSWLRSESGPARVT